MQDYLYYALVLAPYERIHLIKTFAFVIPVGWKVYADHITLMHRTQDDEAYKKILESKLGKLKCVQLISIGRSDKAIAIGVNHGSKNKVSHITLAVAPNASPVESNNITDWRELPHDMQELITTEYRKIKVNPD